MVFEKVSQMISERIDMDAAEITMETQFDDLGLDSLDVMELLMQMEDEFGQEISIGERKITDIGGLVALIEETIQ